MCSKHVYVQSEATKEDALSVGEENNVATPTEAGQRTV